MCAKNKGKCSLICVVLWIFNVYSLLQRKKNNKYSQNRAPTNHDNFVGYNFLRSHYMKRKTTPTLELGYLMKIYTTNTLLGAFREKRVQFFIQTSCWHYVYFSSWLLLWRSNCFTLLSHYTLTRCIADLHTHTHIRMYVHHTNKTNKDQANKKRILIYVEKQTHFHFYHDKASNMSIIFLFFFFFYYHN